MAERRAFRPWISESLEDRLVPSLAAAPAPTAVSGPSLPSRPHLRLGAVLGEAFSAFIGGYAEAVKTVLLAAADDGQVDPAANRLVFNACVGVGLTVFAATLVKSLDKVLGESSLIARVREALLGEDPESLESRLLALPTEAIVAPAGDPALTADALRVIRESYLLIAGRILGLQQTRHLSRGVVGDPRIIGSGDSDESALSSVADEIRAAFSIFLREYFQALAQVLLKAGPEGRVDASANRPAFDWNVGVALHSLDMRLGDALYAVDSDPASSTLTPGASAMIVGNGPDSLMTQLALLPTPAWSSAAMIREFTLDTFRIVASVLALVTGDLAHVLAASRNRG
jgi:hypothetical protein